jgi:hypothetical protein
MGFAFAAFRSYLSTLSSLGKDSCKDRVWVGSSTPTDFRVNNDLLTVERAEDQHERM